MRKSRAAKTGKAKMKVRIQALVTALIIIWTCIPGAQAADTPALLVRLSNVKKSNVEITIFADGCIVAVSANGKTVAELLKQQNISLGANDVVEPSLDTRLEVSGTIVVTRVTSRTVTVDEIIPYTQNRIANEYIPKGSEKIISSGKNGSKTVTYEITYKDGTEVSRRAVSEVVRTAAVDETIEYGSGGTILTPEGETLKYSHKIDGQATAYTTEGYKWKYTRSGTVARVGAIAVDPKVIPLGTVVYVSSPDGDSWTYGTAVCEDTGGAIKGNIVDLFYNTRGECWQFGRRAATIYVLETV
jgi:3D (Asp-Asp-Asp) domain-containing protein